MSHRRILDAEFMYRPRPPEANRARVIFDFALRSRLSALDPTQDTVLLIADSLATAQSLTPILADFPRLSVSTRIANPTPWPESKPESKRETPLHCGWPSPDRWQRYRQSDRWARIDAALDTASQYSASASGLKTGGLVMPAHDAIWGRDLLPLLIAFSQRHSHNSRQGIPACVSPYSFYRHSTVPGAAIPQDVIAIVNTAFNRDPLFGWRLRWGLVQGFWGKTGLIPFGLCAAIRSEVDQTFFEDDSEIDRAINKVGGAARGLWIRSPKHYRQALPVFNEADALHLFERTLHYSLPAGGSALTTPPSALMRLWSIVQPRYARYWPRAERLISQAQAAIEARVTQFGASWLDWGSYRYVTRVGDPEVEVWRLI